MHWSSFQVWLKTPGTPQSQPTRHTCWKVSCGVGVHWSSFQVWLKTPSTPQSQPTRHTCWKVNSKVGADPTITISSTRTQKYTFIPKRKAESQLSVFFYLKLKVEFRCLIWRFISSTLSNKFSLS